MCSTGDETSGRESTTSRETVLIFPAPTLSPRNDTRGRVTLQYAPSLLSKTKNIGRTSAYAPLQKSATQCNTDGFTSMHAIAQHAAAGFRCNKKSATFYPRGGTHNHQPIIIMPTAAPQRRLPHSKIIRATHSSICTHQATPSCAHVWAFSVGVGMSKSHRSKISLWSVLSGKAWSTLSFRYHGGRALKKSENRINRRGTGEGN